MITDLTDQLLERRMKSGRLRLTIQFGCTTKRRNSEWRASPGRLLQRNILSFLPENTQAYIAEAATLHASTKVSVAHVRRPADCDIKLRTQMHFYENLDNHEAEPIRT
jgi:hypothetical protein